MSKKTVSKPAKPTLTLKFNEMSVMDILTLADQNNHLCDEKAKYYRYGNNLKLAYDVMVKAGQRSSLQSMFDDDDENGVPPEIVDLLMEHVTKGISRDYVIDSINMSAGDFKCGGGASSYEQAVKGLFDLCVRNAPEGVEIVRE